MQHIMKVVFMHVLFKLKEKKKNFTSYHYTSKSVKVIMYVHHKLMAKLLTSWLYTVIMVRSNRTGNTEARKDAH